MTEQKSRTLEKVELIQKLLTEQLKDNDKESFFFSLYYLKSFPLLADPIGFEKTLSIIDKWTKGGISFKSDIRRVRLPDLAGQPNNDSGFSEPVLTGFTVHILDKNNIEKCFKKVIAKVSGKATDSNKIKSIEIMKEEDDSNAVIIINKNYSDESVTANLRKGYWNALLRVIEEGSYTTQKAKGIADYFNTNKDCVLYSKTGYELTKVLKVSNDNNLTKVIKIEVISLKKLTQRKNTINVT